MARRKQKTLTHTERRNAYLAAEFSFYIDEYGLEFVDQFEAIGSNNAVAGLEGDGDLGIDDYYQNMLDTLNEIPGWMTMPAQRQQDAFNIADIAFQRITNPNRE